MRIQPSSQRGSIMVICLAFAVILGSILAAYLGLVSSQNTYTTRSQAWNLSVSMAEAGVEEALAQLGGTQNPLTNGWVLTNGFYVKSRTLGGNSYTVGISNAVAPAIYSTGYVACAEAAYPISRRIVVLTQSLPVYGKAVAGRGTISLSGGVVIDSFNSADPNYSTNGQYDPTKFKDNGSIATDDQVTSAITSTGGATVYGHVSTGPGGTVTLSGNAVVGSKGYIQGGGTGIQSGWTAQDMNVTFPDVQAPFSGGAFTPASGLVGLTNYTYVVGPGNYQMSSLNLSGKNSMAVTGNAVLYVTGDISISGQAYVYIAPGATLQLYCGGSSASFTGQGFVNANGNATNFFYYGLPGNTTVSISGQAAMAGVIYAPEASFSMSGGQGYFVGAAVVNSTSISGKFQMHYDESLAAFASRGYVITSWNEF